MIDKKVIIEELRSLDFIWLGSEIRNGWFGRLIGWNATASSVMRKPFTLKRLQEEIDLRHLPLVIEDEYDMLNSFKIILKDAA